jgi:hypothetical protein
MPRNNHGWIASHGHSPLRALSMLAIVVAAVTIAGAARAQNYPWCSNFADGAGTNCGFSTEAQCRITIQGSGGYCDHNNLYRPAAAAAPTRRDVHKRRPGKHS